MHKLKIISIILFSGIFMMLASCDSSEETNTVDPKNLTVELIIAEDGSGLVQVSATAENTVFYEFSLGSDEELIETNTSGDFEYTFDKTGAYSLQIKAFGESGRFIKYVNQVAITVDDGGSPDDGYSTPINYDGYTLSWADEFNGSTINADDWTFETGASGWGNNEWQYYRRENAKTEGGYLVIEARKESYMGSNYTSTRMITKDKQSFKYGRVDIRAKLPEGQGIWPALWMLGSNFSTVGWPACGEIDIMEMIGGQGRENTSHGTLHWEQSGHASAGGHKTLASGTFADKFHVFTIIWDSNNITWYVDDQQFYILDITPAGLSEFHNSFFFIFNVAVGGNWPGYPDGTTIFPQQMKVDYIRVFQAN